MEDNMDLAKMKRLKDKKCGVPVEESLERIEFIATLVLKNLQNFNTNGKIYSLFVFLFPNGMLYILLISKNFALFSFKK